MTSATDISSVGSNDNLGNSADNPLSLRAGYEDFRRFVNPMLVSRAELSSEPWQINKIIGTRLADHEGRLYADFLAGWGTQAFGHRPPVIEAALRDFLDGDTPSFYTSGVSPYAGMLARRLHQLSDYDAAWFASGGSEAVEATLKLARAATGRARIACIEGAYHGCTFGSVAMMQPGPYRDQFGPHLPKVDALPFGDLAALGLALADPNLAAVVIEPVQVEAGLRMPPAAWLQYLCEHSEKNGVLLIADEIQTGIGRCGQFLASATWPRAPDVVTLGKALGGGLIPLSAMLTRSPIFERAYGSLDMADAHASTFSGNALACVAGLAAMSLMDETMLAEISRKAGVFREALQQYVAPSPLVTEIRGKGLLLGLVLQAPDHPCYQFDYLGLPQLAHQSAMGMLLMHQMIKRGFITQICGHAWQVLRLHPPYNTPDNELIGCAQALGQSLDYLWELQ